MKENLPTVRMIKPITFGEVCLIGIFSFLLLVKTAFIGVDYHHQGLAYVTAKFAASGEVPYRDFFLQYGPVPTLIQAIAIHVRGDRFRSLIELSVLLQSVSASVSYFTMRRWLSRSLALSALVVWMSSCYYFRMRYIALPWWTDVSMLCAVLAIEMLIRDIREKSNGRLIGFSIGVVVSVTSMVRLQTGVLVGIVFITLFIAIKHTRTAIFLLLGSATTTCVFVFWLAITGSLSSFIDQAILWPARWVTGVKTGQNPVDQLLIGIVYHGLVAVLILVILYAIAKWRDLPSHQRVRAVLLLMTALLTLLWTRSFLPTTAVYYDSPRFGAISSLLGQYQIMWAIVVLSGIAVFTLKGSLALEQRAVIVVAGAFCLTGIFPVPDAVHLWPFILPLIGPVIVWFQTFERRDGTVTWFVLLIMGLTLIPGSREFVHKVNSHEMVKWNSGVLDGLHENRTTQRIREPLLNVIHRASVRSGPVLNLCQDPVFLASDGSNLRDSRTIDLYYFLWGPGKNGEFIPMNVLDSETLGSILSIGRTVVICSEREQIEKSVLELGYVRTFSTGVQGQDEYGGWLDVRILEPRHLTQS